MAIVIDAALAEQIHGHFTSRLEDSDSEMRLTREYLRGNQTLPFMPNQRSIRQFEEMAKRSISNWLPLVSDTFVKRLFVEGYRPSDTLDNTGPWDYWQANRLDARQTIVHRGAIEYGEAYVLVLPGKKNGKNMPIIKPLSPLDSIAWYSDDDDEFPYVAARRLTDRIDGTVIIEIYDENNVYTFEREKEFSEPGEYDGAAAPTTVVPDWTQTAVKQHGLGVVPFVRFRESLDDRCHGIIFPLIPDQERINEITFAIHMALQYSVFRQRYVTGVAFPEDANGNPVSPFEIGVDKLWASEDEATKFGEFGQTMIGDHLNAYTKAVQTLAAHGQIDPNLLTGDVINVSSEALGSLQDATTQRINIYKMIFGESWEQVFRLAALAAGDKQAAEDESAQARWRDDTAHEFLTTVQGLSTLVEKLDVPPQPLWTKVPGMSDQDIQAWKDAADKQQDQNPMGQLLASIQKQATTPPPIPGETPLVPGQTATQQEGAAPVVPAAA